MLDDGPGEEAKGKGAQPRQYVYDIPPEVVLTAGMDTEPSFQGIGQGHG